MSSNISSVESCEGANVKTAQFIQQTFPVLEQEIAQGEGEYIAAMLNVRGCDVTAHQQIITSVRNDYANAPIDNAQAFYELVEGKITTNFSSQCAAI